MTHLARRIAAFALLGWCAGSGVAHADAAGPTDYRSEIVSVEPSTPSIDLSIEGGDSFIAIEVEPGTEVTVLGYSGEPYLLIETDGTVSENVRSQATYYNQDRFGTTDIPDIVDNDGRTRMAGDRVGGIMGVARPSGTLDGDRTPDRSRAGRFAPAG